MRTPLIGLAIAVALSGPAHATDSQPGPRASIICHELDPCPDPGRCLDDLKSCVPTDCFQVAQCDPVDCVDLECPWLPYWICVGDTTTHTQVCPPLPDDFPFGDIAWIESQIPKIVGP